MKLFVVLIIFGLLQCNASTVNIYPKTLNGLPLPKASVTVTQGNTTFFVQASNAGLATVTLPTDDVWNVKINKSSVLTFDSTYDFANAPTAVNIPLTPPLSSTIRYRFFMNWVDTTANYSFQLFTPNNCVVNKTTNCTVGNITETSASNIGPNYMDLYTYSTGFYRLGATFDTYDSRALIQVATATGVSKYIYQSGVSSSTGFWHVADYLICSWGSEVNYFNEIITQQFTYPWAYDYCLYQPITITGTVQSNVTSINNVTITFVDTTGAYPNVTVQSGESSSSYTADLRTTTYRVLVSQAGYYTYDNTTTFTNDSTTFNIILNLMPVPTTTTTSTSTSTTSTSGTSGATSSGSTTSSSTGAAGATSSGAGSTSSSSGAAGTSGTTAAGTTGVATTTSDNSTTDASTSVATGTTGSTTAGESSASTSVASLLLVAAAIVIVL